MQHQKTIFISGATGYLASALIPKLLRQGHQVHALVRPGSEGKIPKGCITIVGDALDAASFATRVPEGCTYVHLLGAPRPAPWKGKQFRAIDLPSIQASLTAAVAAKVSHLVYVSVAHPAPVMNSYIEVRKEAEAAIRATGLAASILRPWYVLGPSHRWPLVLLPFYALLGKFSATREATRRLALVTIAEMTTALLWTIEHDPTGVRVLSVAEIKALSV
jgi:uncharacterized protein YbjT (DUF2867 family)